MEIMFQLKHTHIYKELEELTIKSPNLACGNCNKKIS